MHPFRRLGLVIAAALLVLSQSATYAASGETDDPAFPRPGGGRQAIYAYSPLNGDHSYLLDTATGAYRRLPYPNLVLSPDRRLVAVEAFDGRTGVASRRALLHAGEPAIRWTSLPPGSPAWWSPDGTALLTTTLDKETRTFTAHRYDLAGRRTRQTPVNTLDCEICVAGWAPDSRRYLVMLRSSDPAILEGPIQYLNPDGSPGPAFGVTGVLREAEAYSPSGRYAIVEPIRPTPEPLPPAIVDLRTRTVVGTVDTAWPLVGWYDDRRVVRVAAGGGPTVLEVVDVRTGTVHRRVPAPDLLPYRIQLGPAAALRGDAATRGF